MMGYNSKKYIVMSLYVVFSILIEMTTFLFNKYGLLPKYFMFFMAGVILLCAFLGVFVKLKAVRVTASILLFIQILISFANVNLLKITGEIFSWDMLSILHEATRAAGKGISVTFLYLLIVLPLLYAFIRIGKFFELKWKLNGIKTSHKMRLNSIITTMLLIALSSFVFDNQQTYIENQSPENPTTIIDDAYLVNTFYVKQEAYKKLGTMGYYVLSGIRNIFNSLAGDYMKNLIESVDSYFDQYSNYENQNDLTGISEGNNVIAILVETWDYSGIHPEFTPNLYRLFQESLLLGQYYSKDQTNISESKTIFGSYPMTGILNYNYGQNVYPFTLPNMFKSAYPNSIVGSFHNNDGNYYNRNESHLQFGFDFHVDGLLMNLSANDLWINLDSEMFASTLMSKEGSTLNYMIPEDTTEPFFSYVSTFVTHGPFVYREELEEYYAIIESYDQPYITYLGDEIDLTNEYVKTYLAAIMDFDKGMGYLLDELEERDLLSTTTLVLISDHYAYYHYYASETKGIDASDVTNALTYLVPAMIYDQKLTQALKESNAYQETYQIQYTSYGDDAILTSNKFFTNVDIVPTLLNLLGIPYDSAVYLGNDVFGPEDSLILSRWGGLFNNQFYSNDGYEILNLPDEYTSFLLGFSAESPWTYEEYIDFSEAIAKFHQKTNDFLLKYEYIDRIYISNYFGNHTN